MYILIVSHYCLADITGDSLSASKSWISESSLSSLLGALCLMDVYLDKPASVPFRLQGILSRIGFCVAFRPCQFLYSINYAEASKTLKSWRGDSR